MKPRVLTVAWYTPSLAFSVFDSLWHHRSGQRRPNPLNQPLDVNLLFAAMLAMVVGLAVAWKWEGVGSGLILGSYVLFAVVNHGVKLNLVFGPILVVGLCCTWDAGWRHGSHDKRKPTAIPHLAYSSEVRVYLRHSAPDSFRHWRGWLDRTLNSQFNVD